jgi:hypothetical protein
MARCKTLSPTPENEELLKDFPAFHRTGNITGMKKLYYGKDALLVKCGNYIYNVTSEPNIYTKAF